MPGPLDGIRVLELGSFIAGPFACRLLADFGADVLKVERPGSGDELRRWRRHGDEETSLLWRVLARNKRSLAVDLRADSGRNLVLDLVEHCDVVVENFRPGTLEKLGLGPEVLRGRRKDLVLVRVSGFGQTGPLSGQAGFGGVAEALGGLRELTGHPDRPPTRVGISLGDSLAGLHAAFGAVMSLLGGERANEGGEEVDVALYESVFNLMESLVPDYDVHGVLPERSGSRVPGAAPSGSFACSGGQWVVIGGNGDAIFPRLMKAIERPDLAADPELARNEGRVRREDELDAAISAWTAANDIGHVLTTMADNGVPAGPIMTAADIVAHPHFAAREMVTSQRIGDRDVAFPGVVPKLARRPGTTRWAGPELGQHTEEVLGELLGLGGGDVNALRERGVVG
ncbi:CoA transferase [Saccharomonospora sp. NPDC006951]